MKKLIDVAYRRFTIGYLDVSISLSIPFLVDYIGQINYRSHSTVNQPTNSLSRFHRPVKASRRISQVEYRNVLCAVRSCLKTRFAASTDDDLQSILTEFLTFKHTSTSLVLNKRHNSFL